jgi:hypothetical protein
LLTRSALLLVSRAFELFFGFALTRAKARQLESVKKAQEPTSAQL